MVRTSMRLSARFTTASPIQIHVTTRWRPTAISTLPDAAWLTTTTPASARMSNGTTLPANPGPIHRTISGRLNPIRTTAAPATSVIPMRLPSTSVRLSARRFPSAPNARDGKQHSTELIAEPPLIFPQPERDGVDGDRGRSQESADDDVVDVEADLRRDVDDEQVEAETGHLAPAGCAEGGRADAEIRHDLVGIPRVACITRDVHGGRRRDEHHQSAARFEHDVSTQRARHHRRTRHHVVEDEPLAGIRHGAKDGQRKSDRDARTQDGEQELCDA